MKLFGTAAKIGFVVILLGFNTSAQGYKGIVPIESACHDVEKLIKEKVCGQAKLVIEDDLQKTTIILSTMICERLFERRWNVPIGTVIGVLVDLKKGIPINEYNDDLSMYSKTTSDISIFYNNREKGVEFAVTDGLIMGFWYLPPRKYDNLDCEKKQSRSCR